MSIPEPGAGHMSTPRGVYTSSHGHIETSKTIACTSKLVHDFWRYDVSACLEMIDADAVFVGSIALYGSELNDYMQGRRAIAAELRKWQTALHPRLSITDENYRVTMLSDSCVVNVSHKVVNGAFPDEPPVEVDASLTWVLGSEGQLMLKLCHLSSHQRSLQDAHAKQKRILTKSASRQTFAVRNPQERRPRRHQSLLQIRDAHSVTHWIAPDNIIFVSAKHQCTVIHCSDREIRVRDSMANVCAFLSNVVLRVHRSYAVNPLYVDHLDGELLYLTTGTKIPIPTRKVRQVRLMLAEQFDTL